MKKPNLVFIFTDQQRADTLNNYIMPNLYSFARESIVFEKAYVTQPVCTPSRSSIMTGLYPHSNGCTENNVCLSDEIPLLNEMLQKKIWTTAYYGKYHLGNEIFKQHGFDEWISTEDMYSKYYTSEKDKKQRSNYHHYLLSK